MTETIFQCVYIFCKFDKPILNDESYVHNGSLTIAVHEISRFLTRPAVNIAVNKNELDITIHVIASQLSDHCAVSSNRL